MLDSDTIGKLRALNRPGKKDLVEELSELFFSDSPALLDTAQGCLESQDYDGLYKAIHRLKGSALYIGGAQLGELCQKIMASAKAEDENALSSEMQDLKPAYDRLAQALKSETSGGQFSSFPPPRSHAPARFDLDSAD